MNIINRYNKVINKIIPNKKYIDIKIWVENIKGQGIFEEQPYIKVINKYI